MEVALVDDEDGGCAELAQVFDKVALTLIEVPGVGDDKRDVDPFEHGPGAFDSGESESADIVDARRVDEDDGTDRREFARLFNGVGRGAGDFGDDRDLLVGQCVDERALAGIALAEEADVKAKAFGGFNHDFFKSAGAKKDRTSMLIRSCRRSSPEDCLPLYHIADQAIRVIFTFQCWCG